MSLPLPILLFTIFSVSFAVDKTLQKQAYGNEVVLATVQKIQESCIFPNDYQFLRRVAWVESRFGKDMAETSIGWNGQKGHGGMWQVDKDTFVEKTQPDFLNRKQKQNSELKRDFSVDFAKINWDNGDLTEPLIGGIVSRAYTYLINAAIPLGISNQAQYWKKWYNGPNGKGTAQDFIDRLKSMPQPCEAPGADLLFIIDSSGSIIDADFKRARNFIKAVVEKLVIGEFTYRVAVDDFSAQVQSVIRFNSYNTKEELLNQIGTIPKYDGATHMADALDHAREYSFTSAQGARNTSLGLPRIAVLVTDGDPNGYGGNSAQRTREAAARLIKSGVELFTVGVGDGTDKQLLKDLASNPKCMHQYQLADYTTLADVFPEELKIRSCMSLAVAPATGHQISNSIAKDQSLYFQFSANTSAGITFKNSLFAGSVNLYLSQSYRHPSPAMYDAIIQGAGQLYLSPRDLNVSANQQSAMFHLANGELFTMTTKQMVPVFGSVRGVEKINNFTLRFEDGNTVSAAKQNVVSVICLVVGVVLGLQY